MIIKDYSGFPWKVHIEEWGHAGIPTDKYKLDRVNKIQYAFIPVRQTVDYDGPNGKELYMMEAFMVGKWRGMTRFARKPYSGITKYVAQGIITSLGANVGQVADNRKRGDTIAGEVWLALVSYD